MKKPLKQIAYDYVFERISSGEYLPGMRLSEVALAKEIGISPTPLREAYRQLASEGLLDHRPNSGIFIKKIEKQEIVDLYELREAIETFCAVKATQLMNKQQTDELEKYLNIQKSIVEELFKNNIKVLSESYEVKYLQADLAFHRLIIQSSQNETFQKIMQGCQVLSKLISVTRRCHDAQQINTTLEHHSNILKYIKQHNPQQSGFWMKKHLQFSRETILEKVSN